MLPSREGAHFIAVSSWARLLVVTSDIRLPHGLRQKTPGFRSVPARKKVGEGGDVAHAQGERM